MKNKNLADKFHGGAGELVFWSFRYFLGRRTIAACQFARDLANAWDDLPSHVKGLIARELEEAFEKDDEAREPNSVNYRTLGEDCDRKSWEEVRKKYKTT
jgi:hypothetical protein